jgi:transcriptional regulator of heat shock response
MNNVVLYDVLWLQAEPAANTSSATSRAASGRLSNSGVLQVPHGSATSSGLLSRLQSTLNPEEAQEYLKKVADLLLEFSRADTNVKAYMCSTSLLQRLLEILNKLEPPILVRVRFCFLSYS